MSTSYADMVWMLSDLHTVWAIGSTDSAKITRQTAKWIAPPASAFVPTPPPPGVVVFGNGQRMDGTWHPVGVHYDQFRFICWVTAPMGRGKSVFLLRIMDTCLNAKGGFCFIDCKARDLIDSSVLPMIPLHREADVRLIDPIGVRIGGQPMHVTMNLLSREFWQTLGLSVEAVEPMVTAAIGALDPFFNRAPAMQVFAKMGMLAVLYGADQPSLGTLLRFFTDEAYRTEVCSRPVFALNPDIRHIARYWLQEFPNQTAAEKSPLNAFCRRLYKFLAGMRPIFAAPGCSVRLRESMDQGHIVLMGVSGGAGEDMRVFLSFFLQQFVLSAMSRGAIRPDYPLIVDEVHIIADANVDILQVMLSQLRSYRIGQVYVHQNIGQLNDAVLEPLQGNAGYRVILGCEGVDAQRMAQIYSDSGLVAADFSGMEVHPVGGYALHAYVKFQNSGLFSIRPGGPPPPLNDPPYPDVDTDWTTIRAPRSDPSDARLDDLYETVCSLQQTGKEGEQQAILMLADLATSDPAAFEAYCVRSAAHRAAQRAWIIENPGCIPPPDPTAAPEQQQADRKRQRITILSALASYVPKVETMARITAEESKEPLAMDDMFAS